MTGRIIDTEDTLAEGLDHLAQSDPRMAYALELCPPIPMRRYDDGFARLLASIVSQQVSTAAARSIWARVEGAGMLEPAAVLAAGEDDLRALGLSRQKVRYAKALAEAGIDYDALRHAPNDHVVKTLTAVSGIGVWTAEIYAMFALGRADVFAPGDLALQEAVRLLYDLPERPKERALRDFAERWSPWRAVAARLLWAYYGVAKEREGIT